MDTIRLRTMTLKSKFTEGKYEGLTVEQVMKLGKQKIANIYYTQSKITFTDEILDMIPIFPDERIEKPGTNREILDKRMTRIRRHVGGDRAVFANAWRRKRFARARLRRLEADENLSKGKLQNINVKSEIRNLL